jgi:hypothetical protein
VRGQRDEALRPRVVGLFAETTGIVGFSAAIEELCLRVEAADAQARDAMFAVVDWLAENEHPGEARAPVVHRRRDLAAAAKAGGHAALLRFLGGEEDVPAVREPGEERGRAADPRVMTDPRGRAFTLGERKALARRPSRDLLEKLLLDPHPEVVANVLINPRTTEADVLRLVARRPGDAAVLTRVARSPRWVHSARIRLALCMHPKLAPELAVPLVALLLRQELRLVATSPSVSGAVRLACLDKLARRPPLPPPPDDGIRH